MKKYIFSIMFLLGCFFFTLQTQPVKADNMSAEVTSDAYDTRLITIELKGIYSRVKSVNVYEIVYCDQDGEEIDGKTCSEYDLGIDNKQTLIFAKLTDQGTFYALVDASEGANNYYNATITYQVSSANDGVRHFYVEALMYDQAQPSYSCVFQYNLSTLNQRVIINPDAQGVPLHVYDHKQYSPSRVLNIDIQLTEDEINDIYSGDIYIFEEGVSKYSYLFSDNNIFNFGLESYGDGLKKIEIYLLKKGQTIDQNTDVKTQLNANKAQIISKEIYLDTIGPNISIEGGQWILVEAGKKYQPQDATCVDAVFQTDECIVTNDAGIVELDYNSTQHQFITYEARDRLGNVRTLHVNVKIQQKEDNSSIVTTLVVSGCVLGITATILGYILIRNNEKKKKISYI